MLAVLGNKYNGVLSNQADTLAWVTITVGVKPVLVVVLAPYCSHFLDQALYRKITTIAESKSTKVDITILIYNETELQGS